MPIKKETALVRLRELYRQAHHGLEAEDIEQLLQWTTTRVFNIWADASIRHRGVSFIYCSQLWDNVQKNKKLYETRESALANTTDDVFSEPIPIAEQIIEGESK